MYPHQHKLTNRYIITPNSDELIEVNLSRDIVTLAQLLKSRGYTTAAFTGDAGLLGRYGFKRGFDIYIDNKTFGGFERSAQLALRWLRKSPKEPFMLFVHGYEAHGKFNLSDDFYGEFFSQEEALSYNVSDERWLYYRNISVYKRPFNLSQGEIKAWNDWYDQKLRLLDSRIHPLLEGLDEMGYLNRTIIVIMSDHGEGLYEHKRFDHGLSLYDELVRVVLILKLPNQVHGRIINQQVRLIDVMPTLLELLGLPKNELSDQIQGVSIVPMLKGKQMRLDAFSETDYLYNFFYRAIRTSDGWKLIYSPETDEFELYDLNTDPGETKNLVESNPKQFQGLRQELVSYLKLT